MRLAYNLRFVALMAVVAPPLGGCKSAYVEAQIVNTTSAAVTLVEVDYPSASFGTGTLAAGETYHYRFKILGSGRTKILWTDAAHHDHSVPGPSLREGQEGAMTATISAAGAQWSTRLQPQ